MTAPRASVRALVAREFPGAAVETLAGDASTRRFHRIVPRRGPTRILMDYGEPFSGDTLDVRLARVFRDAGLPVAEIVAARPEAGCLILEDLGDRTLESVVRDPAMRREDVRRLLERAVRLAARIADAGSVALRRSERTAGPALDAERFRFEMDFFLEHYAAGLRAVRGGEELRAELHALADRAAETPRQVFCHRDFHSRNLMVRDDGELALVDIQDARWGPDSYDLASLLRDAYIDIEDDWSDGLVAAYRAASIAPPEEEGFRRRLDVVSAQRMIKALGTFGFQVGSRGASRYLEGLPRTLARLRVLLASRPGLVRLHELLEDGGLLDRHP